MIKLIQELEILNMLDVIALQPHDKFLCRDMEGNVHIFSPRFRNYIKTLYPKTVWVSDNQISESEWTKISIELPLESTVLST